MRLIKNKKLEELLNKPIDNNRWYDLGYEHATANAIDWFDSFLRCSDGNLGMWNNGVKEDFIKFMMRVSTNYLQLRTLYKQRKNHKLREDWGAFCEWIETLPYAKELIIGEGGAK